MDTTQELIEVYHLLRHQEGKLYELNKILRAVVEILCKQGLGPEYEKSYEATGSSAKALGYAEMLQSIDAKLRHLTEHADQ
jgi:hypothetical protein